MAYITELGGVLVVMVYEKNLYLLGNVLLKHQERLPEK